MSPLTDEEFISAMSNGRFVERKHRGLVVLLYYTAIRKSEALRAAKEQFRIRKNDIIFEVGERMKHGLHTPPLNIPLNAPFADEIAWSVENTEPRHRVWAYCAKTAWNIVNRVLPAYPHFFRLSRITNFFLEGWTIAQVRSWTGLTLKALEFYVGLVDIMKMGESLGKGASERS